MTKISIQRVQLMATGEIQFKNQSICNPQEGQNACRQFLRHEYGGMMPDREVCGAVYLNTKNKITGLEIIGIGSLNSAIMHPREVFKGAILHNASSIILFHNHPSGDSSPSQEDIKVTQRLYDAGNLLGIELLDHVILGDPFDYSLKESGHF